jgi:hypothetical protein
MDHGIELAVFQPGEQLGGKSVRPASFSEATRFEPMNPAPPVTNSITA